MCANDLGPANCIPGTNPLQRPRGARDPWVWEVGSVPLLFAVTQDISRGLPKQRLPKIPRHRRYDSLSILFRRQTVDFSRRCSTTSERRGDQRRMNCTSVVDDMYRLCKAQRFRYKRSDMVELERNFRAPKDAALPLGIVSRWLFLDGRNHC